MARRPADGPQNAFSAALPAPVPKKAGSFRAWFWAFIACALLAGAAFWLTREPEEKRELLNDAADQVNHLLRQTPLAGMGDILRETPPLPPVHAEQRGGLPGTLSGADVKGAIGQPPQGGEADDRVYFSGAYVAPAREDGRVRSGHVSELASWLASRYRPGPDGGSLALNVRELNAYGGAKLAEQGGRASLLRYAFNPAMIDGLYRLYIDRFMADLNVAARTRGLSARENRQFHLALAGQAAILAQALEALADRPALGTELSRLDGLERQTANLNAQMSAAIGELEQMQKSNAPQKQRETVQLRIQGLNARHHRSLEDVEREKRNLASQLRAAAGQGLDEDSLLYVAAWVARRFAGGSAAPEAVKSAARALRDLAHRCAESGG